jgi:hypothetical protein
MEGPNTPATAPRRSGRKTGDVPLPIRPSKSAGDRTSLASEVGELDTPLFSRATGVMHVLGNPKFSAPPRWNSMDSMPLEPRERSRSTQRTSDPGLIAESFFMDEHTPIPGQPMLPLTNDRRSRPSDRSDRSRREEAERCSQRDDPSGATDVSSSWVPAAVVEASILPPPPSPVITLSSSRCEYFRGDESSNAGSAASAYDIGPEHELAHSQEGQPAVRSAMCVVMGGTRLQGLTVAKQVTRDWAYCCYRGEEAPCASQWYMCPHCVAVSLLSIIHVGVHYLRHVSLFFMPAAAHGRRVDDGEPVARGGEQSGT